VQELLEAFPKRLGEQARKSQSGLLKHEAAYAKVIELQKSAFKKDGAHKNGAAARTSHVASSSRAGPLQPCVSSSLVPTLCSVEGEEKEDAGGDAVEHACRGVGF
jgi:hypothetical protein